MKHARHEWGLTACGVRWVFVLFFNGFLTFTACQDYFTHFELINVLGGAKTGDPPEKPPDHPQAELGLSHI